MPSPWMVPCRHPLERWLCPNTRQGPLRSPTDRVPPAGCPSLRAREAHCSGSSDEKVHRPRRARTRLLPRGGADAAFQTYGANKRMESSKDSLRWKDLSDCLRQSTHGRSVLVAVSVGVAPVVLARAEAAASRRGADGTEDVERDGEDGVVAAGGDLHQRLQVTQLQRGGVAAEYVRGHGELLGGLVFALSGDDLRATLALSLGLSGDGPLHLRGQVDVLHLHVGDLDAPRVRARVEHLLDFVVDALALAEELVQLHLTQNRAERRLRELAGGVEIVLHLEHG